jgi:hypothetical protein
MEIELFGFKFRLEILILIVIVYWIMCGHLICSCCRYPIMETFVTQNKNKLNPNFGVDRQKTKE